MAEKPANVELTAMAENSEPYIWTSKDGTTLVNPPFTVHSATIRSSIQILLSQKLASMKPATKNRLENTKMPAWGTRSSA